jgi:hypothetical protein
MLPSQKINSGPKASTKVSDRRANVRFEVVGRLAGTLTAERDVVLHDISAGGALIETHWAIPEDSLVVMRLESETHHTTLEGRVCRVRQTLDREAFLVGLRFNAETAAQEFERLIPSASDDAKSH